MVHGCTTQLLRSREVKRIVHRIFLLTTPTSDPFFSYWDGLSRPFRSHSLGVSPTHFNAHTHVLEQALQVVSRGNLLLWISHCLTLRLVSCPTSNFRGGLAPFLCTGLPSELCSDLDQFMKSYHLECLDHMIAASVPTQHKRTYYSPLILASL